MMPCCAGSEGTFETQKKGRYPYRPQKIESVARSNKTKQPPSPMSRWCRGCRERFQKKSQECLTSRDCSHDATGLRPIPKHYYSWSADLRQISAPAPPAAGTFRTQKRKVFPDLPEFDASPPRERSIGMYRSEPFCKDRR